MDSLSPVSRKIALVLLCAGLTSCVIFDPKERGLEDAPVPESFTLYETSAPSPENWWEDLQSEELNGLVETAMADNLDLQQAYARLRQSKLAARQAFALRWPTLDYTGEASATRTHVDTGEEYDRQDAIEDLQNTSENFISYWQGVNQVWTSANSALGAAIGPWFGLSSSSGSGSLGSAVSSLSNAASSAQSGTASLLSLLRGENLTAQPSEYTVNTESYRLGLSASYELDLWGRQRAEHKAAKLSFAASEQDLHAAMMTVSAEIALRWLDIQYYRQGLALLRKQLDTNRTSLELIELRYRKGQATALDVFQQREIVAQSEAAIPPTEAAQQMLYHEVAVLLGKPPKSDLGISAVRLPEVEGLPDPGLPADLLANRPDVRAAGLRLRSSDWQVGAARADRLPSIRLTGTAAYGAEETDLIFDNWMASLAGSVTGPIFDAGRRRAEVRRTQAVVDERLAAYRETVLVAVREVEDALIGESKQVEYVKALEAQLDAARASHREALARYLKGLNDYLPVLSALMNTQALERSLVLANRDRLAYRVQLYRALGGSWMAGMRPEKKEEDPTWKKLIKRTG